MLITDMHRSRLSLLVVSVAFAFVAIGQTSALSAEKNLWSTINICGTKKHPHYLGIRGRMPGDGHKSHTMWMKFIVQFKNGSKWSNVVGASTKFHNFGSADVSWRSAGRTFTMTSQNPGTFTFRGLVKFQWRKSNGTVVRREQRVTTAGHPTKSSNPKGFSAATCTMKFKTY